MTGNFDIRFEGTASGLEPGEPIRPRVTYPSSLLHGNRGDSESGGFGARDLNRRFRQ
jgi:hypothetical protein